MKCEQQCAVFPLTEHTGASRFLWSELWAAGTCLSRAPWGWDSLARAPATGRLKLSPASDHTATGQATQRRRAGSPPDDHNDPETKKQARDKQRKPALVAVPSDCCAICSVSQKFIQNYWICWRVYELRTVGIRRERTALKIGTNTAFCNLITPSYCFKHWAEDNCFVC